MREKDREGENEWNKIEGKKVKHWNSLISPNITKMIVYLPSNVQESRPQPLSLIDNTSHLEAKRSMRLMVCISGHMKKKRIERERERWTESEREHQGIGTIANYIIAWCIY